MNKNIQKLARVLRKNQTEAEKMLWAKLRNKQLDGYKFLRQHIIKYHTHNKRAFFFIADFYCAQKKLIIELDGSMHSLQQEYDKNRDLILKEKNFTILRFKNEELKDIESVLSKIKEKLSQIPSFYSLKRKTNNS